MFLGLSIVLILGAPPADSCTHAMAGLVVDAQSGKPIPKAQIKINHLERTVESDAGGRFDIKSLCVDTVFLTLHSPHYHAKTVAKKATTDQILEFKLSPSRGSVSKPVATVAEPVTIPKGTPIHMGHAVDSAANANTQLAPDASDGTVARPKDETGLETGDEPPTEELIVRAKRKPLKHTHAVGTLDEFELQRSRGKSLADAVAEIPGVTVIRSGNNAKPVVRGQYGARILMLYDGVRHEGQDWGLDHSPEIDPFAAGSIQVVKGAAGVRYGADAIGGVLLVEPPELLLEPGLRVETQSVYATNNRRATAAARIEGTPTAIPNLSLRIDGNYSRGAALETPDYPLDNTGVEEWNAGGVMYYRASEWDLKLSYRRNRSRLGVCLCARKETTDDFDAQVRAPRPLNSELYRADYEIERPYQNVTHEVGIARSKIDMGTTGHLEVTYAFQRNIRKEYEILRTPSPEAQYNFRLRTHTLDLIWNRKPFEVGQNAELKGMLGINAALQENVYRGLILLSDYRAFGGGVFALERLVFDRFELETGARFDHTTRHAYLPKKTYESLGREGRVDPAACKPGEDFTRCDSQFNTMTFSAGGLVRFVKGMFGRLNLSTAKRVPTIDEQYLNGTSPSFPVMARGDHTLGPETSYSATASLDMTWPIFKGEISAHSSYIDDYIYLSPELREDGTIRTDVLIQGRFPRFSFAPINAHFYGLDAGGEFRFGPVGLGVQASVVRAENTANNEFLLFIPPDQGQLEITYRFPWNDWLEDPQISFNSTFVASQYNVSPDSDFAPVPDGYTLFGLIGSTTLKIGDGRYLLSIEAQNLMNTRYRDYTSLLRYFADEPGRQVFVRFGTQFGPER